jgi:heterodisulfide reductase subunit C
MDFGPDRILRMVLLGQGEVVLKSRDIWLCVGCFTCATRCPNEIDIAAVMDGLRQVAQKRHILAGERDAWLFHQLFMGVVQRLGRSHEAVMLGLFKVLSHVPFWDDLDAGLALFLRGKVPLLPERSKAAAQLKEIFQHRRA